MIGLGGGSLAKFCRQQLPQSRFTAVEINPHIIALRDEFFIPADDDLFRVLEADGADFVQDARGDLDVLLVDGFDHQGQSVQLTSLKFYADCKNSLASNGVLVINFHETHPLYEQFIDRLDRTFNGNIVEVAVNYDGNVIVFASRDKPLSPLELRLGIQKVEDDWSGWLGRNA
jgi:spermidine synthase